MQPNGKNTNAEKLNVRELAINSSLCASRQRTVNITLHEETANTSTKT